MPQKFIGVPQPVGERGKHFQRNIGTAAHKRKEVLAREHSQPRTLRHNRVGRAPLPTEQCHYQAAKRRSIAPTRSNNSDNRRCREVPIISDPTQIYSLSIAFGVAPQGAKLTWARSILGWNRARSRCRNREKRPLCLHR